MERLNNWGWVGWDLLQGVASAFCVHRSSKFTTDLGARERVYLISYISLGGLVPYIMVITLSKVMLRHVHILCG